MNENISCWLLIEDFTSMMALHELEFLLCGFGCTGSECLAHKSSGFCTQTLRVSQVTFKYQTCIGVYA